MDERLSTRSIDELAHLWICMSEALSRATSRNITYEIPEGYPDFSMLGEEEPDLAWQIIGKVLHYYDETEIPSALSSATEQVLGHLAASMLEDLLNSHGERYIDRVEALARNNPRFRWMLSSVWRSPGDMPLLLWERVQRAAKPLPNR